MCVFDGQYWHRFRNSIDEVGKLLVGGNSIDSFFRQDDSSTHGQVLKGIRNEIDKVAPMDISTLNGNIIKMINK